MSTESFDPKPILAAPSMRRMLEDFVRRRVSPSDVDDVVQTVLVEALASTTHLADEEELRRFVMGIAKHKVVDHHRRTSRESAAEIPDLAVSPGPIEARALAEWAEKQAGSSSDAKSTLAWMAREGEGEKLEAIAESEQVPAARIRQRVSRMRRWMKERWLAELAAAAALVLLVIGLWRLFRKEEPVANPLPDLPRTTDVPEKPVPERVRLLRTAAFEACGRAAWLECLDKFNEAKAIDPEGDKDPRIGEAREKALDALRSQSPEPPPTAAPTANDPVTPTKVPPKSQPSPAPKPPAPIQTNSPPPKSPPPKPKSSKLSPFDKKFSGAK